MKSAFANKEAVSSARSFSPFFRKGSMDSLYDATDKPFFNHQPIQTKLTIGQPGDKFEQEADAMADQVVQRQNRPLSSDLAVTPFVQAKCAACEQEEKLQKKEKTNLAGGSNSAPSAARQAFAGGSGKPLPEVTKQKMESSFGTNFSGVRIHTDEQAVQMNQHLNAQAFTHGTHIYFNQGKYNIGTFEGQHLLAHELTHVIQQSSLSGNRIQRQLGGCTPLLTTSPPSRGLLSGIAAHAAIEAEFALTVPGATSIAIPGGSAAPLRSQGICGEETSVINPQIIGGRAGLGFPDLTRRIGSIIEIAEVKPASYQCLIDGEEQLARYIINSNSGDPIAQSRREGLEITATIPMLPTTFTPIDISTGNVTITFAWCAPGLIAYRVISNELEPIPQPVQVPENEEQTESNWNRIAEFVEQLIESGADVEAAIREFLQENRDLIDFVIGAGIGLIIVTIVEDFLTAGAGIIDDFVIIPIATTLMRIAYALRGLSPVAGGLAPVLIK